MAKIKEARKTVHGHLSLEFEDGSIATVPRGEHEDLNLKAGDEYPPVAAQVPLTEEPLEVEELEFEDLATEEAEEDAHPDKPKSHKKHATKKK